MYHSLVISNSSGIKKNTWDDWRLIPTAKPTVPMPEPQLRYADVPGRSGSIDLSTYLTGDIKFTDRSGSFKFYALDTEEDWEARCNAIAEFLHGQKMKFVLEDDPMYYYEGRMSLAEKDTNDKFPTITLDYRVGSHKIHIYSGKRTL